MCNLYGEHIIMLFWDATLHVI